MSKKVEKIWIELELYEELLSNTCYECSSSKCNECKYIVDTEERIIKGDL
jgi:hypothetical protein